MTIRSSAYGGRFRSTYDHTLLIIWYVNLQMYIRVFTYCNTLIYIRAYAFLKKVIRSSTYGNRFFYIWRPLASHVWLHSPAYGHAYGERLIHIWQMMSTAYTLHRVICPFTYDYTLFTCDNTLVYICRYTILHVTC